MEVRQLVVVQPHQPQHRRVQVSDRVHHLDRFSADLVRRSDVPPALDLSDLAAVIDRLLGDASIG